MITCDKATKTSNSLICCNAMFHMLHDFVVILYLSHYYHVAMFQGIRNSGCIHMLPITIHNTQVGNIHNWKMLHMHVLVTMAMMT